MVDAKVPDTRRMAAEAPVELGENNSSFFFLTNDVITVV